MELLNAPMTPKMKADLERMNALRAELEQLETEYVDAIRIPGVQRVRNVAFINTEDVIDDSDYEMDEYWQITYDNATDFDCISCKSDLEDAAEIDSVLELIRKSKEIYEKFENILEQQKQLGAKYVVHRCEPDDFDWDG
ncbi:MAG: hypothetical protein IJH65_12705 [Methanobrevibacter sp.]|nr:hypothetical protein [Methanobrevibacter sp.]